MSLSNQSSWKGLLATLAVLATAGVYGEIASVNDDASEARPQAVASADVMTRDAQREWSAGDGSTTDPRGSSRKEPLRIADPSLDSSLDEPARVETPARARRANRSPNTDESLKDEPKEDPVAKATQTFAARLEAEPYDAKWAPVAEELISEHFPASDGRRLTEAKCRSSVCRIELAYESEAARDDELGSLTLPWDSVGVFQLDEQDALKLVIYSTRAPEDLRPRGGA